MVARATLLSDHALRDVLLSESGRDLAPADRDPCGIRTAPAEESQYHSAGFTHPSHHL